ncbi:hypothetical protein D3C78_1833240 [compost metagenome]
MHLFGALQSLRSLHHTTLVVDAWHHTHQHLWRLYGEQYLGAFLEDLVLLG